MSDIDGVRGYSLCSTDGCWNHYPIEEAVTGEKTCPECRGENREISRTIKDEMAGFTTKVFDYE